MRKQVIGYCSLCGGVVSSYAPPFFGASWPSPSCESCGAVKKENLPTIEMEEKTEKNLLLS